MNGVQSYLTIQSYPSLWYQFRPANCGEAMKNILIKKWIEMDGALPLHGHVCMPSIKHLSWIIPDLRPDHTSNRWKEIYETMCGIQQTLTKKYYKCLIGNLWWPKNWSEASVSHWGNLFFDCGITWLIQNRSLRLAMIELFGHDVTAPSRFQQLNVLMLDVIDHSF